MAEKRLEQLQAVVAANGRRLMDDYLSTLREAQPQRTSVVITDNGFTANVIEGELHDPGDEPTT